jgi:hypothetical protein
MIESKSVEQSRTEQAVGEIGTIIEWPHQPSAYIS